MPRGGDRFGGGGGGLNYDRGEKRGGGGGGGGGKFNKHRNSLSFVKQVPKFLQQFGQTSAKNQDALNEALKFGKKRPHDDDELPQVANLDEFFGANSSSEERAKVRKLLTGESDEDDHEDVSKEMSLLENLGRKHGMLPDQPDKKEEPDNSDKAEYNRNSSKSRFLGGKKTRVRDDVADAIERETGKHVFRRAADKEKTDQKKDKKKKKRKEKEKASRLTFDADEA
mmetsp:Transcript_11324/g.21539  ORF Transcript_11324/g.21539 Transcript_11324/m.21539 type:complete len:226 (-) Transcript_11324:123-800(-)|eukprot:CAMPEP_0175148220 /NCGR_PEP_ID=MMETSP0087-20121206/16487_1 /TAXON_ID=136419 /ORGANISM="Unknown Unknown, Strain D1" /LENGTH=225 /DNA_ID=CAMNT_0016433617 /DNA_START=26 /DNA_END=703 /DNA_ORIENTATION=+